MNNKQFRAEQENDRVLERGYWAQGVATQTVSPISLKGSLS